MFQILSDYHYFQNHSHLFIISWLHIYVYILMFDIPSSLHVRHCYTSASACDVTDHIYIYTLIHICYIA